VRCWGEDTRGRVLPSPEGSFVQIEAAYNRGCGVRTDETVACWYKSGRLETVEKEAPPVHVSAGAYQSCAIDQTGDLFCWGACVR